jgi:predicted membrane channel-forming protein YqfA (hemolysin III family)
MNPHVIDVITRVVFIASIAHSALPPWEFLSDFPTAQKVYKAFVYLVGFIAINGRSTVYHSISIATPDGVNESVINEDARINVKMPKP